jgi:hypothetical protein
MRNHLSRFTQEENFELVVTKPPDTAFQNLRP